MITQIQVLKASSVLRRRKNKKADPFKLVGVMKIKGLNASVALNSKHTKVRKPPVKGIFLKHDNEELVYHCEHRVHQDFCDITNNSPICPTCTTVQKVWDKENQANRILNQRLIEYNNSANWEWPAAVSYNTKQLWTNVMSKWEFPNINLEWWYYLSSLPSFRYYLNGDDIRVRCLEITSMKKDPKETREIHGAALPYTFNNHNNKWNPQQIFKNPGDGSFGLVDFLNGDYACIGTVNLSNETIEAISRSETKVIGESKMAKRAGSAGGFMYPVDDPEVRKDTKSMSKCTKKHRLLTTSNGFGTALTLHYINNGLKKKVNSVYPDLAVDRKKAIKKRKEAEENEHLRKKLIGEMKSRLSFLMILLEKSMGTAYELFKTFTEAAIRVKKGKTNWNLQGHNEFDCVLLEYGCGTGEMRNHQALCAHTDTNTSHPVESMMLFGKVPEGDIRESTTIVNTMRNGMLIQPFERIVWELCCGRDVLHSRFSITYHLSDLSRGDSNWSYVHGP
jgi:hypothetical protein